MTAPLFQYAAAPFVGPQFIRAGLVPLLVAAPFEGLWVPMPFIKTASLELAGVFDSVGIDVYGTNDPNPQNGYTVTVGGSATATDVLALTFALPGIPPVTVSYIVQGGDSTTVMAAALAAAINANATLQALGITATSAVAVVTVNYPSLAPGAGNDTPAVPNQLVLTKLVTGGSPSETLTIAVTTTGVKLGATLVALGLTALTPLPMGYVKARLTGLTGTNAKASLNLVGTNG